MVAQKNPEAIANTALILKGIREFIKEPFDKPWLEITDLSSPKFHVPTWKQFCEVLQFYRTKKVIETSLKYTGRYTREVTARERKPISSLRCYQLFVVTLAA